LIGGGLGASARFALAAWRGAWAALTLAAAVFTGTLAAAAGARLVLPLAVWFAAAILVALIVRSALWRLAFDQERRGPAGLQFGEVELRIAAAWALSLVFLAVLALLLFVIVLCSAYAAASAGHGFDPANVTTWAPAVDDRGRAMVGAVASVGGAAVIFAAARISLAEAATVARGKIQVLSVWALTRGRVIAILAANALIAVPAAAAFFAMGPFLNSSSSALWCVVGGVTLAAVWLPMSVGLMAYVLETCAAQKPVQ
jgi:hypothetical protein